MSALRDDCFAFDDKQRMKHAEVLAVLAARLTCVTNDETVALDQAAGRILALDMLSTRDTPATDNAAVDGYAFAHSAYLAHRGQLTQTHTVKAGDHPPAGVADSADCSRIFTGAPLPDGFDTVAMQEDCQADGTTITIPDGLKHGANRRKAGEDVRHGATIAKANQCLRAADIAALAAAGHATVPVRKPLRIGLLSTGNEIVQPGTQAFAHQVYDANRPMLATLFDRPYTTLIDLGHIQDDPALLRETLTGAANHCDLIITSGGASRGDEDHLFETLRALGNAHIWQIAIKPGRPMMFGQIGNTVLMALPGNPVAALVCSLLYGRPITAHLCGANWREPVGFVLPAAFPIDNKKPDRREFLRGWRVRDPHDGAIRVEKFERDGSGLISGLQAAEGLISIDEEITSFAPDTPVRFIPFSDMEI